MMELSPDLEGARVAVEFQGVSEEVVAHLREAFRDQGEDVLFSHAFSGLETATVLFTLGKGTLEKLMAVWGKVKVTTPKTKVKVGPGGWEITGFELEDVEALIANPEFQKMAKLAKGGRRK